MFSEKLEQYARALNVEMDEKEPLALTPTSWERIESIRSTFELSELQVDLFVLVFLLDVYRPFRSLVREVLADKFGDLTLARIAPLILGQGRDQVVRALSGPDGLMGKGLISTRNSWSEEKIPLAMLEVIYGEESDVTKVLLEPLVASSTEIDRDLWAGEMQTPIQLLLESLRTIPQLRVLIWGAPGLGKSSLVSWLIREANAEGACVPIINRNGESNAQDRLLSLALGTRLKGKSAIVCDEADSLLNQQMNFMGESMSDRLQINLILEQTKQQVVFIANDVSRMHASTLRRFDFVLPMMAHPKHVDKMLEKLLLKNRIEFTQEQRTKLAEVWTNLADMDKALLQAKQFSCGSDAKAFEYVYYVQKTKCGKGRVGTGIRLA